MSSQGSNPVWVWSAVGANVPFRHPSEIPVQVGSAKASFGDDIRGPRIARISAATLLQSKGLTCLIAERGATREVPKSQILTWYEGLLLLQELETAQGPNHISASWCDEELRTILQEQRTKFRHLSAALYAERKLATVAVTGVRFVDADDKEYSFRRENVRADAKFNYQPHPDQGDGYFQIRDVIGYLPPWEAFCHSKCGFYQDFYSVRWAHPFSEVDYSSVENGCSALTGVTWEPDECLPSYLDPLRAVAKRTWIKSRREREHRMNDERLRAQCTQAPKPGLDLDTGEPPSKRLRTSDMALQEEQSASVKVEPKEEKKPQVKLVRNKRSGEPLERDLYRTTHGHDFEADDQDAFSGIRSGWPKSIQEYPVGYGVADPPGFCREGCDCMDDQRPQRSWEMSKPWLEDPARASAANACIEALSNHTNFVRRRGQVSRMCYFETATTNLGDETHARAALNLASMVQRGVSEAVKLLPLSEIRSRDDVHIPGIAFLTDEVDYEPLRYDNTSSDQSPPPPWLHLSPSSGLLYADSSASENAKLQFEIRHVEGLVTAVQYSVVANWSGAKPWVTATGPIMRHFNDLNTCSLEASLRVLLTERFSQLFDFTAKVVHDVPLGMWLGVMTGTLRMLRAAAMGNVMPTSNHRSVRDVSARSAKVQPHTPPG